MYFRSGRMMQKNRHKLIILALDSQGQSTSVFIVSILIISILLFPGVLFNSSFERNVMASITGSDSTHARPADITIAGNVEWRTDSDVDEHINVGGDPNETRSFFVTGTLTIFPGVTVEFASATKLYVQGTLIIKGTPEQPVNFTSNLSPPSAGDWDGLQYLAGSNGYVNHSNINYCTNGVLLTGADNIRVTNCSINKAFIGIKSDSGSHDNQIDFNEIYDCDTGMGFYNSNFNVIKNNVINNTTATGLSIGDRSNNNRIELNQIFNGTGRGISLSGKANNNTILSNEIHAHLQDGIRCSDSSYNVFKFNEIYLNQKDGIIVYFGSDRNLFQENTINNNDLSGFSVGGVTSGQVIDNEIIGNKYGFSAESSTGIEFVNNTLVTSTIYDILVSQVSNISSINNTFNSSKVMVYDFSLFYVYWHMFLETRDENDAFTSALVNITNSYSEIIIPDIMIAGKLDWIKCLGSIYRSEGQDTSMNPYWVLADNGSKVQKMGFDMSKKSRTCVVKFLYYPPPESTLPSSLQFAEDSKFKVNLSNYFTSSEVLDYDVEVLSGGNITYIFNEETKILSGTPPANWNGQEVIRASVLANLGGKLSRECRIEITPVNDPPIINKTIPGFQKQEGTPPWELNLSSYATDNDLIYGDTLTWFVTEIDDSFLNITVTNNSQVLRFTMQNEDLTGNKNLTVWVRDQAGAKDSRKIWVNITPINDDPRLTNMMVLPTSGFINTSFNFSVRYFDPDGDQPNYVTVKIDNKTTYQMIETNPDDQNVLDGKDYYYTTTLSSKAHYFWFECSDGQGGYNITPRINGPLVTMPDKGFFKGQVIDKDTKTPIVGANVSIKSIDNGNSSIGLYTTTDSTGNYSFLNLAEGQYQLYATADGYKDSNVFLRTIVKGAMKILDFELEKLPVDIGDTPITLVWIEANRTNISQYGAIDFIGHAEDLDGDILTYEWNFADGTGKILGKQVSHTFYDNGTFNVTLKVRDTDGNEVSDSIVIKVTPAEFPYPTNGDGDGSTDGTSGDAESSVDNFTMLISILIIIIIIVVLIVVFMFIQIRRRMQEEEVQRLAEKENQKRMRAAEIRQRKKRERELEFVDREKRNVEQVNLLITEMHSRKAQHRGARGNGRSREGGPRKGKLRSATAEADEVDDAEDDNSLETGRKKEKSNNRKVTKRRKRSE